MVDSDDRRPRAKRAAARATRATSAQQSAAKKPAKKPTKKPAKKPSKKSPKKPRAKAAKAAKKARKRSDRKTPIVELAPRKPAARARKTGRRGDRLPSVLPPGVLVSDEELETAAADAVSVEGPREAERARQLSERMYDAQWGRAAVRARYEAVDDFGWDPEHDARVAPLFELLYRRWFRVEVRGMRNVPTSGRAMLVANHGGTMPWDGVMLKTALRLEHDREDELRWLAEDFVFHMPFVGAFMNRIGAVRACQENAERLLEQERLVAVFPEGIKGVQKLYRERYALQRFGRGGYVKLALRTGTPLLPTAIVGADETNPMLYRVGRMTRALGIPFFPITPTFPLLGPLGLLPAPARWRIVVGEPFDLDEHGPDAAEDAVLVNRLNDRVRSTIQRMVDDALQERGPAFFG